MKQPTVTKPYYPSVLSLMESLYTSLVLVENMPPSDNEKTELWIEMVGTVLSMIYNSALQLASEDDVELVDIHRLIQACETKSVEQIAADEMLSPELVAELLKTASTNTN